MRLPGCWALGVAFVLFVGLASAQVGSSTITGRITDSTGAVIPKVSVSIVQTGTNYQFSAVTNEDGIYRVPSLSPGAYRISFEAAGFKKLVRDGIELRAGDVLAVDVALEVGAVTESVQVTGAAPLLETETSATGALVEGETLHKLPLYQRYINLTLNLVPGLSMGGYAYGGSLGSYHLAGQRNGAIGIFEDGVNGNEQTGGTTVIKPIQNSVEEVKVLTTTLPAEYGHSAGGVIAVVKKSGTNEFHGLAADYGRSRRMQHRLFFDNLRTSDPRPGFPNGLPTWFMDPEANASGPVYIPKVYDGRNKTFVFFGYQKLIEKKAAQVIVNTPTDAMKNGDFTFGGKGNPIYDPSTTRQMPDGSWVRDPIPGNVIPLSRFNPVAQKVLGYNPWVSPNAPGSLTPTGPVSNLITAENSRTFFEDYSTRIDHQFSSAFKIYGSYTYNHQSGLNRPTNIDLKPFDGSQGVETPYTAKNFSFGGTYVISPTTINDARVGYFRVRNDTIAYSYGQNWPQKLGIPNVDGSLMPQFGAPGGNRYADSGIYGLIGNGPNRSINETLSFRDDLTKIVGSHAFKMGYELLRFRLNSTVTNRPSGAFYFDTMTAGLQPNGQPVPNTGNTFAGFLMGYVREAYFDAELTSWLPRSSINSFYFQDDWKFSPRLTLNLGVRYSNESPYNTKYGLQSNFAPTATDPLTGKPGAIIHPGSSLNSRDNNNFQPRIGLAWHPVEKWVFRGGFAVNTVDVKFPQSRTQFDEYVAVNDQVRATGDPRPLFLINQGPPQITFPIRSNDTALFVNPSGNYSGRNVEWWDPSLRNPYVLNFNASLQYQVAQNYVLEMMYQGSSGVGLIERWQANTFPIDFAAGNPTLQNQVFAAAQNYRPFPNFGNVYLRSNFGHSTYHSGTVKLEKRYSQGLTFSTFYTFSKAIDSQDSDNSGSGVAPLQNRALEKARAGYDRNHRFIAFATYELPVGKGRKFMNRGGVLNAIFGGYEIAWIQTLESGNPYTFSFADSPYNYYPTFAGDRRPNLVKQPTLLPNWGNVGPDRFNQEGRNPIIDINDFAYPAAFTPGNSGRNIMTGTRLLWTQVSAQKNWTIKERARLQLRWDFQNPFHNYNFDPPSLTVTFKDPGSFGKLLSDQRTASIGGEPLMDLTLQLTW
ncbi:MAG TPA: TonB-dependent receptor [Bryobacteraceae bacterium]|nr:TonB-dependent receptor [Bryobacteraceae bacterium]